MTTHQEAFTKCTGALEMTIDALEERNAEIARLHAQRDRLRDTVRWYDKGYRTTYSVPDLTDRQIEGFNDDTLEPGDMTDES